MAAKQPEDLLLCHAVHYGPADKQVLRSLRSHQDDSHVVRPIRSRYRHN
jgi:hypothetical protein